LPPLTYLNRRLSGPRPDYLPLRLRVSTFLPEPTRSVKVDACTYVRGVRQLGGDGIDVVLGTYAATTDRLHSAREDVRARRSLTLTTRNAHYEVSPIHENNLADRDELVNMAKCCQSGRPGSDAGTGRARAVGYARSIESDYWSTPLRPYFNILLVVLATGLCPPKSCPCLAI
jgi:hypothetical protein